MSTVLEVVGLGRMAYEDTLDLQRSLAAKRINRQLENDVLLLVEHPPVITLGRSSHDKHVLQSQPDLQRRGVSLFEVERGGDVTFHGPGQLVGYTIFDLKEHKPDLHLYLRQIESCIMRALETFGLTGSRNEGLTGVWIDDRKIASIGIHVKQWVTWHGFALNVSEAALGPFSAIVPCGIPGVSMTSLESEGLAVSWEDVVAKVESGFGRAFEARMEEFGQGELERLGLALELGGPDLQPAPAVADHG